MSRKDPKTAEFKGFDVHPVLSKDCSNVHNPLNSTKDRVPSHKGVSRMLMSNLNMPEIPTILCVPCSASFLKNCKLF